MMRCAACHRPLKNPAVKHGHAMYGPVCATKYFGRLVGGVRVKPERDERTADLFEVKP